jgi:cytochrome c
MNIRLSTFKTHAAIVAGVVWLFAAASAVAADGAKIYQEKACGSCHGPTGDEPILPTYPKIAGQNRQYLINQINDIKGGARKNGASIAMQGIAATLRDDEIVALAEYLSSL